MVNPDPAMFPVFGFGKKVKEQKNYYNFISFFALVVQKCSLDCYLKNGISWLTFRQNVTYFLQFPNFLKTMVSDPKPLKV